MFILPRYGANADAVNYGGISVLHLSVDLGHRDVMLTLLRHNANVNRRLYLTYSRMDPDMRDACNALACHYVIPIVLAAIRGRTTLIKPLVRAGASARTVMRLVNCGLNTRTLTSSLSTDTDLVAWLREQCSTVTSLQQVARLAVRASLRSPVIDTVQELPLPRSLLDFVAFSDLDVE
jgi:SOCS box